MTSRRQGYRLHLDADARDALTEVLPPRLVRLFHDTAGTPNARFTALDHQLNELVSFEAGQPAADFAVDRLVLRQILFSGVEDAVAFDKELTYFDNRTAYFADGTKVSGDVLVAADGVNSAVRRQYLPHARIMDTGVWQLYGRVPLTNRTRPLFDYRMRGIFTVISGPERTFSRRSSFPNRRSRPRRRPASI